MRKSQLKQLGDRAPAFYTDEVERLRTQLRQLTEKSKASLRVSDDIP